MVFKDNRANSKDADEVAHSDLSCFQNLPVVMSGNLNATVFDKL